jgi:Ser/Thr protein kinase RdoA (MazF antagonist)
MMADSLLNKINRSYAIPIQHLTLHREMIGRVYWADTTTQRYVLKLYRSGTEAQIEQTAQILDYLSEQAYPAAAIVRTIHQDSHMTLEDSDENADGGENGEGREEGRREQHEVQGSDAKGWSAAVLYEHIDGVTPDGHAEAANLGEQVGRLHRLMEAYPHPLLRKSKADYIDDYLAILREKGLAPGYIADLEQYGQQLWRRIVQLPASFCHGDLHTGNMLRNPAGDYVLFDWDDASGDYPAMDVTYLTDDTHFNQFQDGMVERTLRLFERFYSGYSRVRTLSDNECQAVFDFIAIRHFQIIARIVRCQGLSSISMDFCKEQHDWLMRWQELCLRKRF